MVGQSPKTNNVHHSLSPINGATIGAQLKAERSPSIPIQEPPKPNSVKDRNSISQPTGVQPQFPPHSQPQSPLNHQQSWQSTYTVLPQPQGQAPVSVQGSSLASPIYPTFTQASMGGISTPGNYPSIPNSLASLLQPPGDFYTSYQLPLHAQNGVGGAGVAGVDGGDSSMTFSPGHYYDGPGPLTWPLISMPPGQQS